MAYRNELDALDPLTPPEPPRKRWSGLIVIGLATVILSAAGITYVLVSAPKIATREPVEIGQPLFPDTPIECMGARLQLWDERTTEGDSPQQMKMDESLQRDIAGWASRTPERKLDSATLCRAMHVYNRENAQLRAKLRGEALVRFFFRN